MKLRSLLLLSVGFFIISSSVNSQVKKDYGKWVNIFIGTGGSGGTFPGPSLPFGMVQPSPETGPIGKKNGSGYHYTDTLVYGFSQNHLSGLEMSGVSNFLFMPTTGEAKFKSNEYVSSVYKKYEKATIGYYATRLKKYNIDVELTCTKRVALHRYKFLKHDDLCNVLVDLQYGGQVVDSWIEVVNDSEIRGYRKTKGISKNQEIYFYARFSKSFESFQIAENDSIVLQKIKGSGKNVKLNLVFEKIKGVDVQIAVSPVSAEGAYRNMEEEMPNMSFNKVTGQARATWNYEFSKLDIAEPSKQHTIFYTSFYHCMLAPNLQMDVDGRYRGLDGQVHRAEGFEYYSSFALWNSYRTLHPLLSFILPKEVISSFIKSFLVQFEQTNSLPVFPIGNDETNKLIGNHAIPVIVDAYMKGITDFDTNKAFEAMKVSANRDRFGLTSYIQKGAVFADEEAEAVSKTLAYAYDDWCLAQFAKLLNKQYDYQIYIKRAQYWKNVYEKESGFMRAKINGEFVKPFNPTEINAQYKNGNAWHSSFDITQDVDSFLDLIGGTYTLEAKIDSMFSSNTTLTGTNIDKSGFIGQYNQANPSCHHIPYLYHFTENSHKTFIALAKISELYTDQPDGIPGNDMGGQLSAWLVMNALGIYPVNPCSNEYFIGQPWFKRITMRMNDGKKFSIISPNPFRNNIYVQRLVLNDQDYYKLTLKTSDITAGGFLVVVTGKVLNQLLTDQLEKPVTRIDDNKITPIPYFDTPQNVFTNTTEVAIKNSFSGTRIYYSTDGSTPTEHSNIYGRPLKLNTTTIIKAVSYNAKTGHSIIAEGKFNKASSGYQISVKTPLSTVQNNSSVNSLIDGLRGKSNFKLGGWIGFQGNDFEAVIDLGDEKNLNKISIGFLQDTRSWIIFPKEVSYFISDDNKHFRLVKILKNETPASDYNAQTKDITLNLAAKARYIRVIAKNYGLLPHWHEGVNNQAWLFVDEIIVE